MPYVFSTMTNDVKYAVYTEGAADLKIVADTILIKGGTGVMNDRLITPLGVATEVTAEQLAALEANPVFKAQREAGYLVVQDKKASAEKVASDMNVGDGAAPLTPETYKKKGKASETDLNVTTN